MKADFLVKGINIAVMNESIFVNEFPALKMILSKSKTSSDWDLFMTAAGVGIYYLKYKLSKKMSKEIGVQLAELNSEMPGALSNFLQNIQALKGLDFNLQERVGNWVLRSLKGNELTYEESKISRVIGIFLETVVTDLAG